MLQRTEASQVARVLGEFLRLCRTPGAVVSQDNDVLIQILLGLDMTRWNGRLIDVCHHILQLQKRPSDSPVGIVPHTNNEQTGSNGELR
jgi:hypothetical protein